MGLVSSQEEEECSCTEKRPREDTEGDPLQAKEKPTLLSP